MPPDGYDTVTLPTDLVQEVDSLPLGDSRTAIVRSLVAYYREGESGDSENLTTTVEVDADEVVDELKEAIVELNCPVTPDEEKSSEELVAKIEQLEAAVKEATQAAQSTEQTVEDLQG